MPKIVMETEKLNHAVQIFSDKLRTIKIEIETVSPSILSDIFLL